jgi:hypothetical protein
MSDERSHATTTSPGLIQYSVQAEGSISPPTSQGSSQSQLSVALPRGFQEGQQILWGYLVPLDENGGDIMVLKSSRQVTVGKDNGPAQEQSLDDSWRNSHLRDQMRIDCGTTGGYIVGRDLGCGE